MGPAITSEDQITHSIMVHLRDLGWNIFQYHPPGGQANFGVMLGKNMVYPDIIASKDKDIFVIENKILFNTGDINKLVSMNQDKNIHNEIILHCHKCCKVHDIPIQKNQIIKWAHGFSGQYPSNPHEIVDLIYVKEDLTLKMIPSEFNSTEGINDDK